MKTYIKNSMDSIYVLICLCSFSGCWGICNFVIFAKLKVAKHIGAYVATCQQKMAADLS